jgi:uncharacterized protein YacL
MINNNTQETWGWQKHGLRLNYNATKLVLMYINRILEIIGFLFAFMMISAINGIVIRFALVCSNVVLVPIMMLLNAFGINNDDRSRSMIYHSMGLIGAQMAFYDS